MRIGIFLCKCRGEVSNNLDTQSLAEYAKTIKDVVYVDSHAALCSSSSAMALKQLIKDNGLDHVVIAACSPKYYENIFRKNIENAGLNPGFLSMANIREQCAWPHRQNPVEALNKAKLLLKTAVEKVRLSQPIILEESTVTKSVMVVGAGIAGIHAALSLADQGIKVHLVDKSAVIGGNQIRFAKAFPRDECSPCAFAPIIARVVQNDNITIHTLSEVVHVSGRVGEYKVVLSQKPRYVDEKRCTNCGDCTTVCPSEVDNIYEFGLDVHKRIHIPYPEAYPHCRVVNESTIDECRNSCKRYCENICKVKAVNLDQKPEEKSFTIGGIIVCTGYKLYVPTEFHYKESKNVVTLAEYERIVAPDGVTDGEILRLSDRKKPDSIAFILCVGSRDPRTNPYCSKYCCMASATLISQTKEKSPNTKIYVFYKDIQTVGKMGDEYVRRTQEAEGVEWIRAIPLSSKLVEDDRISLRVDANGGILDIAVDMVVLANGMEPQEGSDKLRKVIGLDKTEEGFFRESDLMLNPVSTFDPGKYICGCCVGPKAIAETITEARSAAASCASVLGADKITQEVLVSKVDEDLCGNCKVCLRTCIFGAVGMVEERRVSYTDNTLCRGCGNCVAACPSSARDLVMYPNDFYKKAIDTLAEFKSKDPKVLVIACNGCAYPAADQAAQIGGTYPPNVLILRVPCAGRVDTQYVEYAFSKSFEGVFIGMCHVGSCHYVVGNEDLMKRMDLLMPLLEAKGVPKERLKISEISPSEGRKFVSEIHAFLNILEKKKEEEGFLERETLEEELKKAESLEQKRQIKAAIREMRSGQAVAEGNAKGGDSDE